LELYGWSL